VSGLKNLKQLFTETDGRNVTVQSVKISKQLGTDECGAIVCETMRLVADAAEVIYKTDNPSIKDLRLRIAFEILQQRLIGEGPCPANKKKLLPIDDNPIDSILTPAVSRQIAG